MSLTRRTGSHLPLCVPRRRSPARKNRGWARARLVCLLLWSADPAAAQAPPRTDIVPQDVPATLHDVPVNAVVIGRVARLEMGKTRLTGLHRQRIIPEIRHAGDAGDSRSWGCFSVANGGGPVVIRPGSGEMGGDDVIRVDVERAPAGWPSNGVADCPIRTGIDQTAPVTLDDGLRFGSSMQAVVRVLGRPSLAGDDLLDFRYAAPVTHCPGCEGIEGDIAFRSEHGTMVALELTRISVGE